MHENMVEGNKKYISGLNREVQTEFSKPC